MDASLKNLAQLFKVLSDPTRLGILEMLTTECQPVSAIVSATGRSQPLVSHHLRILRECGLARTERQGTHIFYWLRDESVWEIVERWRQFVQANEPGTAS